MIKPSLRLLLIGLKLLRLRFLHRQEDRQLARKAIANGLAQAGGIAMKLGQVVADIGNTQDYDRLLSNGHARPLAEMLAVLENALGQSSDQVFFRIEPTASAASLGQVHAAYLLTGEKVAIKIQYPSIEKAVNAELKLAGLLPGLGPIKKWGVDLNAYRRALASNMQRELDYNSEAKRQLLMADNLHVDGLVVPRIYPQYCSRHVLVQSWEEGVSLDAISGWSMTEKMLIGRTLLMTLFQSLFELGEVHGDPHKGNVLYRQTEHKPEVVLLDYGCTIQIPKAARLALLKLILDTRTGQTEQLLACFVGLGFDPEKLSYIADEMALLAQILFQPFTTDQAFTAEQWEIKQPFEKILGEKKWWFRSAGPADLFLVMRAFQGVIRQLSTLNVKLPWWPLLEKSISPEEMQAARDYMPEPFPLDLLQNMEITPIAQKLNIQIQYADQREGINISLPAQAALTLEQYIPDEILQKLGKNKDFSLIKLKQQVLDSKLKPQRLFEQKHGGSLYRVYLE